MRDSVNINGVEVGPSTDVTSLLRRQLLDGSILSGRYDDGPEPGIRSLFEAARGTALEGRIVEALLSLLTDADERVRAGAASLVLHNAEKFDPSELLAILESNPTLYRHIPLPNAANSKLDLGWTLMRAIAASPTKDMKVIERLRQAVRDPTNGSWVLAGLMTSDPDWVIKHPLEAIDEDPTRARVVMFRLGSPELRRKFVRALPRESPRLRRVVADAVSVEVSDPTERDELNKLLA